MLKRRIQVFIDEQASRALDRLVASGFTQVEAIERGLIMIEGAGLASRASVSIYESERQGGAMVDTPPVPEHLAGASTGAVAETGRAGSTPAPDTTRKSPEGEKDSGPTWDEVREKAAIEGKKREQAKPFQSYPKPGSKSK